jgi:hypothetical protein
MTARAVRCETCGCLILAKEGCPSCDPTGRKPVRKFNKVRGGDNKRDSIELNVGQLKAGTAGLVVPAQLQLGI